MMTERQIADADDELSEQIDALTAARRELYTIHRDALVDSGMEKADVLIRIRALKAAIAKRRKLRGDKAHDVRTLDELTDEILIEISAEPAQARAA